MSANALPTTLRERCTAYSLFERKPLRQPATQRTWSQSATRTAARVDLLKHHFHVEQVWLKIFGLKNFPGMRNATPGLDCSSCRLLSLTSNRPHIFVLQLLKRKEKNFNTAPALDFRRFWTPLEALPPCDMYLLQPFSTSSQPNAPYQVVISSSFVVDRGFGTKAHGTNVLDCSQHICVSKHRAFVIDFH